MRGEQQKQEKAKHYIGWYYWCFAVLVAAVEYGTVRRQISPRRSLQQNFPPIQRRHINDGKKVLSEWCEVSGQCVQ